MPLGEASGRLCWQGSPRNLRRPCVWKVVVSKFFFWDRKREKKRKTPASVSACALGMERWLFFLKIRTENEGGGLV